MKIRNNHRKDIYKPKIMPGNTGISFFTFRVIRTLIYGC